MAALMGYSREAVDGLLFLHSLVSPPSPPESGSPVGLTPAALASLDLAVLYLKEGRAGEVKELAREMAEVFRAQGIAREAFAALTLLRARPGRAVERDPEGRGPDDPG
jgi:hypothetical protein